MHFLWNLSRACCCFCGFKVIHPAGVFALPLLLLLSVCLGALAGRHLGKRIAFCGSRWKVLVPLACKAKEPRHVEFYSELNHDGTQFLPGKRFASVDIEARFFKCAAGTLALSQVFGYSGSTSGYIEYQFIKAGTRNLGRVFCSLLLTRWLHFKSIGINLLKQNRYVYSSDL
jgi:hypothetical protein